jgi:hypothetical protein
VAYEFATMGSLHDILHGMSMSDLLLVTVNSYMLSNITHIITSRFQDV